MVSLKTIFNVIAWKNKLWLFKNTLNYLLIRIYCFNKKIIVCYGSVADTFIMIQHGKCFLSENPKYILIGSREYKDVFRIFGVPSYKVILLSDNWCSSIFNYSFYSGQSFKFSNRKFFNLNVSVYEYLKKQIINSAITMREALLTIAPIKNSKLIYSNYPIYSLSDAHQIEKILSNFEVEKKRIILINPIGYTHKSLSRVEWSGLAKVLEDNGFIVIFNVKNTSTRPSNDEWIGIKNAIQVPAYLLPLLSQNILLTLARPGGAFDISFGYSQDSNVLIFLNKNKNIYKNQLSSNKEIHIKKYLSIDFGRTVNHIEINEEFCPRSAGYEVLSYLNNRDHHG
jgi:hypothetical protein